MNSTRIVPYRTPYRDTGTADLLAARESIRTDLTDIGANGDGWSFPDGSAAFLRVCLTDVEREIGRRERLRSMPGAPPWPDPRIELDDIKQRVDLAAFIARYAAVAFRRCGRQLRGKCPFHDGVSSTSFVVNPDKGLWHCHGCLRGGDIFDFALHWFNCQTFGEAVDLVAHDAGVRRSPRRQVPRLRTREVRHA